MILGTALTNLESEMRGLTSASNRFNSWPVLHNDVVYLGYEQYFALPNKERFVHRLTLWAHVDCKIKRDHLWCLSDIDQQNRRGTFACHRIKDVSAASGFARWHVQRIVSWSHQPCLLRLSKPLNHNNTVKLLNVYNCYSTLHSYFRHPRATLHITQYGQRT